MSEYGVYNLYIYTQYTIWLEKHSVLWLAQWSVGSPPHAWATYRRCTSRSPEPHRAAFGRMLSGFKASNDSACSMARANTKRIHIRVHFTKHSSNFLFRSSRSKFFPMKTILHCLHKFREDTHDSICSIPKKRFCENDVHLGRYTVSLQEEHPRSGSRNIKLISRLHWMPLLIRSPGFVLPSTEPVGQLTFQLTFKDFVIWVLQVAT